MLVHVPACVFTPVALGRYRECQEAVEAAGARGAWLSVDGDETGQLFSSGAHCCIRHGLDLNIALEHWSCLLVPPRLRGVLNPHSRGRHHRASASVDLITLELDQHILQRVSRGWVWATVCWRVSVCTCKCDDMLGRCYCEERETELLLHSACLSSGWPQSCILDQTQNHKAQCV